MISHSLVPILPFFFAAVAFAQTPANDTPGGAPSVAGGLIVVGTTVGATGSGPGVSNCSIPFSASTPDVWYLIQPITTGPCVVETCEPGSATFDTMLAVYLLSPTGAAITCNDDNCGLSSRVTFTASAGLPYFVRVGGYGGATGEFRLSVLTPGFPPPNDDCANAIAITAPEILGSDYLAVTNPAETPGLCASSDQNVWYTWTNPSGCPMTMTASLCVAEAGGAGFDSIIGIWQGNCGSLSLLACNDNYCGYRSRVTFTMPAYSTVYVSIGSRSTTAGGASVGGNFVLTFYGSSAQVTYLGAGCAYTPGGPAPALGSIPTNAGFDAFVYMGACAPSGPIALYVSSAGAPPFALGSCQIFLDLSTYSLVLTDVADNAGNWTFGAPIPNDPALWCAELVLQGASVDPLSGAIGITNGVQLRIGYQLY